MNTGASDAPPRFVRRIVVDHRERPSGVPTALAAHPNVEITLHQLTLGDYRADDTLIVERKTLADFALSVRDGRLFSQVARLARSRKIRPCLILEGTPRSYPRLAIPRPAFQGALVCVTMVFCVPVLRSSNPDETADLILYAAAQLQQRNTKPPRRFGYSVKGLAQQQSHLLQAIPEIGPSRAERLLAIFGSPFGVASAAIEELQTVEGIGPSAAAKIHKVFHSP